LFIYHLRKLRNANDYCSENKGKRQGSVLI